MLENRLRDLQPDHLRDVILTLNKEHNADIHVEASLKSNPILFNADDCMYIEPHARHGGRIEPVHEK